MSEAAALLPLKKLQETNRVLREGLRSALEKLNSMTKEQFGSGFIDLLNGDGIYLATPPFSQKFTSSVRAFF